MQEILADIQGGALSQAIRFSQWRYAAVNTAHVFGIAMLFGAILPMDLRLLGLWSWLPRTELARILVPVAAAGLALAMSAGVLLFVVRAKTYGVHPLFQIKMALVLTGVTAALVLHARAGIWIDRMRPGQARLHGTLSLVCWIGAVLCGRLIAYVR